MGSTQQRMILYLLLGLAIFVVCVINLSVGTWQSKQLSSLPTKVPTSSRHGQQQQQQQQPIFRQEPNPRPTLDSIVQGWNITGDASWLLNFAIVGFPKCGTSTLMFHLQNHPQVQIFGDERCDMSFNQQARLIKDIYQQLPAGPQYTRGLKCPMDLENPALSTKNYNSFFPHTDFIVGIRHPILWFESFYNFRVHNQFRMPPAETLIGKCQRGWFNLCTFRSNFHIHLANLGKTPLSPAERAYMVPPRAVQPRNTTHRRVFLYEVSQLSHPDREATFRTDLQHFLGLTQPIPPMIWFKPGKNHTSEHMKQRTAAKKIDICHDKYHQLRQVLLEQAVNASTWIREYFVMSPDVTVSSREYFVNTLLPSWHRDPCKDRSVT